MASQIPPPADKVQKLFFVALLIGAALWVGAVSVFVLAGNAKIGEELKGAKE